MRYGLLGVAIILDVLQAIIGVFFFALQVATPIGGGIAGGLAAGYYCWSMASGILTGIRDFAACAAGGGMVGGVLSVFAIPMGGVVDMLLSFTAGAALMLGLAMGGMFYIDIILPRFIGEAIPFFNFLPIWSNTVWKCIKRAEQEESGEGESQGGGIMGMAVGAAAGMVPGGPVAQMAAGAVLSKVVPQAQPAGPNKKEAPARAPMLQTRFADIKPRAANDNTPTNYANAA